MDNKVKEISERIKGLRESENISIESLARELNIQSDIYQKYENGELDPPIGLLSQLARKFNIDLTSIITGEDPRLRKYSVVRKDKAPIIQRRREYKYQDLSYNFVNKKAETFLVTVEPKKEENINLYSHQGQEFNYVIEGSLKIMLNNNEIILNEGDSIYFNSEEKHAMIPLNNKKAKFLAVVIS
ncbi:MAG TPA: XRE family transcriptional regulator [Spirochaetota bacterium]|jgi:transcriptional regulator with XRE-family HTH domain|nr:MAG: Cupin domain protein [Spirochaetes bacterium ADurb.Bin133]HPY88076.1 XRE family transcriptional regulator [Spirochaetota bacterium]HQB61494.1 XRE family transcriptional regulator [Spirochaetota bacterium]